MRRVVLYTLGVLMVAVSCINEQNLDVTPTPGKEVKFAADMNSGAVTKTLYGADTHPNPIKVKWVDGDKVKVFGTTCAVTTADYEVVASGTNTPNSDDGLNVAETLNRIGEVGVQWGTEPTSDFVAVYPSDNASFDYDSESGVVTATTTISSIQNYVFNDEPVVKTIGGSQVTVWEGTHFANDATNPSMQNAIMYAREDGVANGDEVGLTFKPYSTVLKFRFMGFDDLWDDAGDVYVSSITLTAPSGYNIAGDFELDIPRGVSDSNPVVAYSKEGATNLTNSITINTIKKGGSYLKLTEDQAVEFNVFTVPLSGLTISNNNLWTVSIKVEGVALPYIYEMVPLENGTYELVPGLIHKVKIPALVVDDEPIWNPGNWITQIPKPVYISELSVPGAWYCTDSQYQSNTNLTQQYAAGIRAFHIDCRLSYDSVTKPYLSDTHTFSSTMTLVCAGTESSKASLGLISELTYTQGVPVATHVENLLSLVRPDEYIVIVLSVAETPMGHNYGTGRFAFGTVAPRECLAELNTIIETLREKYKCSDGSPVIYNKKITENTTVEDVLGHAIVKINVNTTADKFTSYDSVPSTLISMGSMAAEGDYMTGDVVGTNVYPSMFKEMQSVPLYWGKESVDMQYHYHHAQRTLEDRTTAVGGIPYYADRKEAIDDIIGESKGVYDASHHNSWFQIGIGGSRKNNNQDDAYASQVEVNQRLNPYLYGRIVSKMDTDPSPVGIVLMNNATSDETSSATVDGVNYTASSQDLVKAIIEMNGKFYLNRRGNDVITGGGEQNGTGSGTGTETKASAYVGPDAF